MERALIDALRIATVMLPLTVAPALSDSYATLNEAASMAERAAGLVRESGIDGACRAFMADQGPFRDRDLYVWVWRRDGRVICHAATPALVGRDLTDTRDVTGAPMGRMIIAVQGRGVVEYEWPNPQSRAIEHKTSTVIAVGDLLVGVGAYTPHGQR